MIYKLFDLKISINSKYLWTKKKLEPFRIEENEADFSICVTDDEIRNESEKNPGYDDGYYEMICIFRQIIERIVDFDGIFIHSSVFEIDKKGYMLTGKSGVGKSTQTKEWKKYFGDRLRIINGDKPIIRFLDDKVYAYGSPWCGEEGWFENDKTAISSVCFLKQSDSNKITKIDNKEVLNLFLKQLVIPKNPQRKLKQYDLMDKFIKSVNFYMLECDISENAVLYAYNEINK